MLTIQNLGGQSPAPNSGGDLSPILPVIYAHARRTAPMHHTIEHTNIFLHIGLKYVLKYELKYVLKYDNV